MKLLIVEDDETNIHALANALSDIEPIFARSRDSAFSELESQNFDLIVLDLKIPTTDGSLDSEKDHGFAVDAKVEEISRGTPVVFFSGYGTLSDLSDLLERSEKRDVLGVGEERTMRSFIEKSDMAKCVSQVREFSEQIRILESIDISFGTRKNNLTSEHQRILRIFARLKGGQNIRVVPLSGLSSARTCRIEVRNKSRMTVCNAVAKLDAIQSLRKENQSYQNYVSPIIEPGGFPPVIEFIRAGAAGIGGLFYSLAQEHQYASLLDELRSRPESTQQIVGRLKELECSWFKTAPVAKTSIERIRRGMISDEDFFEFTNEISFDWQELEKVDVSISQCPQHRDLHPLNVLVKNENDPLMIDFGETGMAPACTDPLVLELSLLFHPDCRNHWGEWPTIEQAQNWDELEKFNSGSPFPGYIQACREWAFDVEEVDRGVFAVAYAFAVRQLKYKGNNRELVLAIAEAAYKRVLG